MGKGQEQHRAPGGEPIQGEMGDGACQREPEERPEELPQRLAGETRGCRCDERRDHQQGDQGMGDAAVLEDVGVFSCEAQQTVDIGEVGCNHAGPEGEAWRHSPKGGVRERWAPKSVCEMLSKRGRLKHATAPVDPRICASCVSPLLFLASRPGGSSVAAEGALREASRRARPRRDGSRPGRGVLSRPRPRPCRGVASFRSGKRRKALLLDADRRRAGRSPGGAETPRDVRGAGGDDTLRSRQPRDAADEPPPRSSLESDGRYAISYELAIPGLAARGRGMLRVFPGEEKSARLQYPGGHLDVQLAAFAVPSAEFQLFLRHGIAGRQQPSRT